MFSITWTMLKSNDILWDPESEFISYAAGSPRAAKIFCTSILYLYTHHMLAGSLDATDHVC